MPKSSSSKPAGKSAGKSAAKAAPKAVRPAPPVKPYAMYATAAGGPDVFERREFEPTAPGEGEVLIRHTAIGLNFIDVYQRNGLYPAPGGHPSILGSEAAGVVEAIGAGVSGLKRGDRVAYVVAGGAYASHRIIPAHRLVKVPSGISDEEAAAAMLKGLTAQYLIHDCYKAAPGDTVLVHAAAGGVGSIVGQWLKAKDVTAIGTAGGPEKVKQAKKDGYKHVIDYRKQDFVAEVAKLTNGQGCAAVYDSVGKDTYPGSLKCLRKFGTFVSFGQSSGPIADFKLADLAGNGSLFATRPTLFHYIAEPEQLQKRARQLFAMIKSGKVKIRVDQTFALADVAVAHTALEGRQTTGQTVLVV